MTALPPVPEGTVYRRRVVHGDQYTTTGTFFPGGTSSTLEHLVSAPVMILDCDLCDFERGADGTKAERKAALHAEPDLAARIAALAACVSGIIVRLCGAPPTRIVSSGYGVHVYLWLTPADALRVADVRRANRALVRSLNEVAGFALADPAVHDAGTRILRVVGTVNTKNKAMPRPVVMLQSHATTHDLAQWLTVAPQRPAPSVPRTSTPPAPHVATSDPFASAFAREANALAWVLAHCPFFVWAQAHPEQLGRAGWRGAAVNIAALAGEGGRAAFHTFSALDAARYDRSACDQMYTDALKSAESHGPISYATLSSGGDWPGPVPDGAQSPASSGRQAVRPAPSASDPGDPGEGLRRNAKTNAVLPTLANLQKLVRDDPTYGRGALRRNLLRRQTEHGGSVYKHESDVRLVEYLDDTYRVSFPLAWITPVVIAEAREHEYCPVRDWLSGLAWDGACRMIDVLVRVLGVTASPLHVGYLRSFLLGAVARVLTTDPRGVKVDTVLVLKGPQGARKSTFFSVLGGAFFSDSDVDLSTKDGFMSAASAWIIEWAEIDHALSKHQQSAVKKFVTSQVDSYRPPYARATIHEPRRSVVVGTTNEDVFLIDAGGSRRFHVLGVSGIIDTDLLSSMRDQLWAEAVHLYRSGCPWHLDSALDAERVTASEDHQRDGRWDSTIRNWVAQHSIAEVTVDRILTECIIREAGQWTDKDRNDVAISLERLHFQRFRPMVQGVRRGYVFRRSLPPGEVSNVVPFPVPQAPSRKAKK